MQMLADVAAAKDLRARRISFDPRVVEEPVSYASGQPVQERGFVAWMVR